VRKFTESNYVKILQQQQKLIFKNRIQEYQIIKNFKMRILRLEEYFSEEKKDA